MGKYCIFMNICVLTIGYTTLVIDWMCSTGSSLLWYFGNWIFKTLVGAIATRGGTSIISMLVDFVNVVCTFGWIFVLTKLVFWVNNLNKFCYIISPLLLLTSFARLPLILCSGTNDHPSSITQSKIPNQNTLKVGFGVVNFDILVVMDISSFSITSHIEWIV